jgi:ribonucleotide reductase beta subunit family protein with ferritin-like domain
MAFQSSSLQTSSNLFDLSDEVPLVERDDLRRAQVLVKENSDDVKSLEQTEDLGNSSGQQPRRPFVSKYSAAQKYLRKPTTPRIIQSTGSISTGSGSTSGSTSVSRGGMTSGGTSVGASGGTSGDEDLDAITERISKLSGELNHLTRKLEEKKKESRAKSSNTSVVSLINQLADLTSKKKDLHRYSFFPIKDEESFSFYKRQEAAVWSANEMDFIRDKKDYDHLEPRLKHLVDMILGFFAPGDGLIAQNIVFRFLLECETFEEQAMFITQLFIELVHAETYGMTIMVFHPREEDQNRIFSMCEELPCVKAKADWMNKYMYADVPKSMRYLAFSACEGIFFSVLFSIIFWFRSKGILQNFIFSNEQISKDEGLHRDFGAFLFKREIQNNPFDGWQTKAEQILDEALEIELEFLKVLVPEPIDDLSFESLADYAKMVTDNLRGQLGLSAKYKIKNALTWMNDITLTQKTNFYEGRVGQYKSFSVSEALNWKSRAGLTDKKVDVFDNPDQMDF